MTPRRLPLRPDTIVLRPSLDARNVAPALPSAGWTRKTFALTLHLAGLGLFGLTVVWPLVGPIASGEAAREFAPLLVAWDAWAADLLARR